MEQEHYEDVISAFQLSLFSLYDFDESPESRVYIAWIEGVLWGIQTKDLNWKSRIKLNVKQSVKKAIWSAATFNSQDKYKAFAKEIAKVLIMAFADA